MTNEDVLDEFRAAGALREGHFILSSGLHSAVFLQKNLVFMHPDRCERLCKALAEKITAEVGEPSIYVEREGGAFKFRRAFHIEPGARVAMVEDIVSTGLSSRECVEAIEAAGGEVVCAACLVDRSGGTAQSGAPMIALATLDVPAYPADALPPHLAALPAEEPGSRRLNA